MFIFWDTVVNIYVYILGHRSEYICLYFGLHCTLLVKRLFQHKNRFSTIYLAQNLQNKVFSARKFEQYLEKYLL